MIVRLRLFAAARQAAGVGSVEISLDDAASIDDLLRDAIARFGTEFAAVLGTAKVWVNGDEPEHGTATHLRDGDEVAVLPPVSGGAASARR